MIPRKHPRFAVQFPVSMRNYAVKAQVSNLSVGGCCVRMEESGIPPKDFCTLYLHLPAHEQPLRVDTAKLRWCAASNVGLQFIFLERREVQRLDQYIAHLAAKNPPPGEGFPSAR